MSEDESFSASRGQCHSANITSEEHEANDSIMQKVKSRVSSILPQTFSKWFSPTTISEENRNGNLRRRRCEEISLSDNDLDGSQEDKFNNIMPPVKKSRLNYDEPRPVLVTKTVTNKISNNKFISSTPMFDVRGRKELHSENYLDPVFVSPAVKTSRNSDENVEETDIIEVVPKLQNKTGQLKRNSISTTVSSRLTTNRYKNLSDTVSGERYVSTNLSNKGKMLVPSTQEEEEDENEEVEDEEDEEDEDDEEESKNHILEKLKSKVKDYKISNGMNNISNLANDRNENHDSASESGESQCSSIGQQQQMMRRIKSGGIFNSKTKISLNPTKTATANGFNFYSHLEGKKSLFSSKNMHSVLNNSTMSLTSLNRRQQFNASLYGSTSALSDSRLLNTTSPFYKGRTTYGGASAYGNPFMSSSARQIRITPTLIRPSSSLSNLSNSSQDKNAVNTGVVEKTAMRNPSNNAAISSTAKRILELMDQFTTPLNEARKLADSLKNSPVINNKKRFSEADYYANKANNVIRLQKPRTPYSRPQETINNSKQNTSESLLPPVNELQVPSMAQLLQLKTLQANTERNREIATSNEKSALNQRTDFKTNNDQLKGAKVLSNKSGKIKNKITSTRPTKNWEEIEVSDSVELPNIPLPMMKSVPKIDIPIQVPKSPHNDSIKCIKQSSTNIAGKFPLTSITSQRSVLGNSNVNNTTPSVEFKFSSPIKVDHKIDFKSVSTSEENFKFSSPSTVESFSSVNNAKIAKVQKTDEKSVKETETAQVQLNSGTKGEPSKTSIFVRETNKAIPQLKSGSVLDALKKPLEIGSSKCMLSENTSFKPLSESKPGFGDAFKKPNNQWECSVCMIRNEESRQKCLACETPRKLEVSKTSTALSTGLGSTSNKLSLSEQFKSSPNTWECNACMVRNKNENTSCVACNTSKPASTKNENTTKTSSEPIKSLDTGFKQIVAQQNAKWECSTCMTRNESNRSKCICCEQSKPGTNSSSGSASFSFGAAASKFTFGFSKSDENSMKKAEEKTESKTVNISTSQPSTGFKFGTGTSSTMASSITSSITSSEISFDISKSQNKTAESSEATKTIVSSGFSFGLNKVASSEKASEITEKVVKPEVKSSTLASGFGNDVNKDKEKPNFVFGSASSKSDVVDSKNKEFSFGSPKTTTTDNATIKPNLVASLSTTASPTAGFTFGSPLAKTDSNTVNASKTNSLFSSPSTLAPTLSSATTTASSLSAGSQNSSNFIFGSNKNSNSPAGATFGATTTSNQAVTPNKTSVVAPVTTTWSSVFGSPSSLSSKTNSPISGGALTIPGGFGNPTKRSNNDTTSQVPANTMFQFGSNSKTNNNNNNNNSSGSTNNTSFNDNKLDTGIPAFGSQSSNTTPNSKAFTFGSSTGNAPVFGSNVVPASSPTMPFVFGSAKSTSNTNANSNTNATPSSTSTNTNSSIFGSAPNSTFGSTPAFGSSSFGSQPATQNAIFGQSPAAPNTNLFSTNTNVVQQQQPPKPSSSFTAPNNVNLFGSANSTGAASPFGTTPINAGSFGTLAASPVFGNTASGIPTFGNPTPTPAFGSTTNNNTTFNMPSQDPAKKSTDTPFNFGAPTQNTPTGGFSFGSNNNNAVKPAFNFSAQTPASFNFTGTSEATNSSQPFQFGAISNTATIPPVFNFGNAETSSNNAPFTFNAPSPATNIFAPTPTPGNQSTSQARRKMRSVTRRTQPR